MRLDASIAGLIGVAIGAFVTLISNYFTLRREREQWERNRRSDQEKWLRDRLHETYSNCIYYLLYPDVPNHIFPGDAENNKYDRAKVMLEGYRLQAAHKAERQKWLNILAVHHPQRGTQAYDMFLSKMRANELTADDTVQLAASDSRLKVDFGGNLQSSAL